MKKHVFWIIILMHLWIVLTVFSSPALSAEKSLRILCSTFPIYQITRNVVKGYDAVEVELMLPAQLGCPHDYALTPQDMKKLGRADVLIVNGLGLEEFPGAPIKKANDKIIIIDSSRTITGIMKYNTDHNGDREKARDHGHAHDHDGEEPGHEESEEAQDHDYSDANPHLFASPRMAAKIALNIAAELSKLDPRGVQVYLKNAQAYADKMNRLADEFASLGKNLKNNRIVTQHGVFDYLARDMGLEIVAVVQAHAGQDPSAAEMLEIVRTIKEKQAGAVFIEPQYPAKTSHIIAKEAGIPAANGPDNAGDDYYEKVMRENLATLKKILGTKK